MKKETKENIRVEVILRRLGNYGGIRIPDNTFYQTREEREKEYMKRASDMCSEIERHVDNVGCAQVVWDTQEVCSFCEGDWHEEDGKPQCCDDAIDEWERENSLEDPQEDLHNLNIITGEYE